jgi:uncharacterized protein (TIGR02217 family)
MDSFHEVRLPLRLAFGSSGGIERLTRLTSLSSGYERRSTPWALGRRRYVIGAALRSLDEAAALLGFFEARRGRLCGFRFRDFADFKSSQPSAVITALDQRIGTGGAGQRSFQLTKTYGDVIRPIAKPLAATVRIAVAGTVQPANAYGVDATTGLVSFGVAPASGAAITAGFEFDTPVRFDTDRLDITLDGFDAARAVSVPLIEVRV